MFQYYCTTTLDVNSLIPHSYLVGLVGNRIGAMIGSLVLALGFSSFHISHHPAMCGLAFLIFGFGNGLSTISVLTAILQGATDKVRNWDCLGNLYQ